MRAMGIRWKPSGIREVTHRGKARGLHFKIKQEVYDLGATLGGAAQHQGDSGFLNELSCDPATAAHRQDDREHWQECRATFSVPAALGYLDSRNEHAGHTFSHQRAATRTFASPGLVFVRLPSHFSVLGGRK